ncbi:hypothetical protein KKA08_06910, partial [bacterium]|nr:hypothetical protein [bacterium]
LNESLMYNETTIISTNAELTAIALAQKILTEASRLDFDEETISARLTSANDLTEDDDLGPDGSESFPNFDDVDDYHGVTIVDSTTFPSVPFTITGNVEYVSETNPSTPSGTETFLKKLKITVTSPYMVNPASDDPVSITLEQIFGYF